MLTATEKKAQITSELNKLNADARKIINAAAAEGREITQAEAADVDAIYGRYDSRKAQLETLESGDTHQSRLAAHDSFMSSSPGRKTDPHIVGEGTYSDRHTDNGSASQWVDAETGKNLRLVSSTERLVDHVGSWTGGHAATQDHGVPAAELVAAIIRGTSSSQAVMSAMQTTRDSSGGWAVDGKLSAEILDLARDESVVISAGARTILMPAETLSMVSIDADPEGAWTPEGEQLTVGSPILGKRELRAFKYGCIVPITRELVRGAANLVSEVQRILGVVAAQAIDSAALTGNGVGQPLGLFIDPNVVENDNIGSATALSYDTLLESQANIALRNGRPNAAIMNPTQAFNLNKAKGSDLHYLAPPSALDGVRRFSTNKLADTQAVIGNFTEYLFAVREGVRISISEQATLPDGRGFTSDHVLLKMTWSGDGMALRPNHFEKITLNEPEA